MWYYKRTFKITFVYLIIGLNQLLWYFSDLERKKCYHLPNGDPDFDNAGDACMKWRRFANVFESSQSLFWASFGMVDLASFELTGIKTYTRFWGLLMFGSYSVINVIVLLNLLIAMMSNSYAMIDEHSDTEWKFARTKLWMSYFEETGTLPPPFNIFPKPKNFFKLLGLRKKDKMRRMSTKRRNREEKERDYRYTAVMRALVWRYVSSMHRKCEEATVTEDDINELKSDISSFRYEILEVLGKNGMDISSVEKKEKAVLGKKMKVWERRLMKDFKVAPVASEEDEELFAPPPENEDSLAKFRRIAKMAVLDSGINKWQQIVKGAQIASQIGHCHSRDSFTKQQNLQKAIEEAKRLVARSPENLSRATTPIYLPDMTGADIFELVRGDNESEPENAKKKVVLSPNVTLLKQKQKLPIGPKISIDPPKLPALKRQTAVPSISHNEDIDLINLESAKSSPVPSLRKSANSSSSNSLDEVLNTADVHASNDTDSSDDKIINTPPIIVSPPREDSIDSPSKSSWNSKQDSFDSLNDSKIKEDEELETPEDAGIAETADETSREKIVPLDDKQADNDNKEESDKTEKDKTKHLEDEKLEQREIDLSKDSVKPEVEKCKAGVEKESSKKIKPEVEPDRHAEETTKIEDTPQQSKSHTEETKPKTEETAATFEGSTSPSKAEETLSGSPAARSQVSTPLTQRNIQRIQDTKRDQPKYGWL